jgi:type IV pilus assembly protein PilY1
MTYTSGKKGIEFVTPSDYTSLTSSTLPQALIDDLCQGVDIPYPCNSSTTGDATKKAANQVYIGQLVDYLRGDRARESQTTLPNFRKRTSVLGDIVNATPVFVGKPTLAKQRPDVAPFPTGTSAYSAWAQLTAVKERDPVLYASANDGMLHALNATTGAEIMAYVPSGTFDSTSDHGLHYLADPTYNHRFYVDLSPSVSDVWMKHRTASGGVTASAAWRTVVLGGQRQGGRSLFLLDVTDPDILADVGTNAEKIALWEFTHDDLGYSFSKPTITMMNNGKFAAVFGNGYNSGIDGGAGECQAKLFIVYLEGGVDGTWDSTDYHVIDTNNGGTGNGGADCNGLSTPTLVDLNRDGIVDRVYAGDVKGNLWAFDLCNYDTTTELCATESTNWKVGYGSTANPTPIMTANDGENPTAAVQPITVKPAVSLDPLSANTTDVIIAFGTGQYLTTADLTNTQLQTIYGVREEDALTNGGNSGLNPRASGNNGFKVQTLGVDDCDSVEQTGCSVGRTVNQPDAGTNSKGWLVDLYDDVTPAGSGERVIANPKIRNNNLFINTLIPESGTCAKGGDGWVMAFNLADGDKPREPVWDIHVDGTFDAQDTFDNVAVTGIKKGYPGESTFLGKKMYTPCEDGKICEDDVNVGKTQREGRMSWKEIYEEK